MKKTDAINETIESELQAMKEGGKIERRAKLEDEMAEISKILRSRKISGNTKLLETFEGFCEANLSPENLREFSSSAIKLELNILASENKRNRPALPEVFNAPLENLDEVFSEKKILENDSQLQLYLRLAETLMNERI